MNFWFEFLVNFWFEFLVNFWFEFWAPFLGTKFGSQNGNRTANNGQINEERELGSQNGNRNRFPFWEPKIEKKLEPFELFLAAKRLTFWLPKSPLLFAHKKSSLGAESQLELVLIFDGAYNPKRPRRRF